MGENKIVWQGDTVVIVLDGERLECTSCNYDVRAQIHEKDQFANPFAILDPNFKYSPYREYEETGPPITTIHFTDTKGIDRTIRCHISEPKTDPETGEEYHPFSLVGDE